MTDDNELKSGSPEDEGPVEPDHGMRPVTSVDPDLEAVIDEAVEAVEAVARRREEGDGNGAVAGGDADQLQTEVANLRDRLLRTLADFDNFRKRVEREREEERRYSVVEPLREMLGIVDNLERALTADGDLEDLRLGVEMILKQMGDFLRRSGAQPVEAMGQPFNPSVHEAVSRVEDSKVEVPMVIDEMQRGYTVHERLLRPAIVRVAVPIDKEPADAAGDESPGDEVDD
jgi:molecular chaperone GrpE